MKRVPPHKKEQGSTFSRMSLQSGQWSVTFFPDAKMKVGPLTKSYCALV